MLPAAHRVVQFVRRQVIPQVVPAVVRKPEVASVRMPVEAHTVADALGVNFQVPAIRVHAHDRGKAGIFLNADIAGRADRYVEFLIRSETDEFPAVPAPAGKGVVDHHGLAGRGEVLHDIRKADHPVDFRHVKISAPVGHPVGRPQAAGNHGDLVGLEIRVFVDHGVDLAGVARTHEKDALRPCGDRPGIGDVFREDLNLKVWRQGDLIQGEFPGAHSGRIAGEQGCCQKEEGKFLHTYRLSYSR